MSCTQVYLALSETAAIGSFTHSNKRFSSTRRVAAKAVKRTKRMNGLHVTQIDDLLGSGYIKASAAVKTKKGEILTSDHGLPLDQDAFRFMYSDPTSRCRKLYSDCKGWKDDDSVEDEALLAKLQLVAAMASDRAEMHAILATQRDNWNKLFQDTLRLTTISAAMLSALNGGPSTCLSLSLAAALLNVGSAGMMYVVNQFQPSQLAEEQRTATRLFRDLEKDIGITLKIDRRLREDFHTFLKSRIERLHSLDKAYPLPLTPGGLEKFPEVIVPAQLSPSVDESLPEIPVPNLSNGWTSELASDLKNTSELIKAADVAIYLDWAKNVLKFNKMFATAAPLLAAAGGAFSIFDALGHLNMSVFAACFSILSMFASSLSHDTQLGMIFELYRNSAGYFADIDASIQRAIRMPVEKRENGALFHQRVALMLGRRDQTPIVSVKDKRAGSLF
ncbi:hypothetical protein O6H91_17G085900 [Diphasiastrum complanatum]|uniref:Uncharacterized protein n=3 Tax=Diphasiastrum complanatum TaxID=34168 RepID=A0ACC2B8S3_DIPCM|nr:hypothetical protein O6H91_17G085300 [Diphasiastrum complanatum]KAJ7526173.1 hypothetical protein O6H91_17G085500 [Diphasiastrum complanatum]KAJ7526182.1 hypothetical protein O6H91_17G085900 [Diphasiastrum complanatum]